MMEEQGTVGEEIDREWKGRRKSQCCEWEEGGGRREGGKGAIQHVIKSAGLGNASRRSVTWPQALQARWYET